MSGLNTDGLAPGGTGTANGALLCAALDSRQRWRDLVLLAADIAFETDAFGRFALVMPDPALGWSADALIGQPAEHLLAHGAPANGVNPFCPSSEIQRRRAWVKRADGSAACLAFSAAPLLDAQNHIIGVRGIGCDVTRQDGFDAEVAAALRRGEVLDYILSRVSREVLAPRMLAAALEALVSALGAEGGALFTADGAGGPALLHETGSGGTAVLNRAATLLLDMKREAVRGFNRDGRRLIVAGCQTRLGEHAGVTLWRASGARDWDADDGHLVSAAVPLMRFALEHEAIQHEMTLQARTDPLTGLLNRRAFLDEVTRNIERLDREGLPGTLLFFDLDNFKPVNDVHGHEAGDRVLACTAQLLRDAVRPTDLVARLGGDEFAVWMNGADHLSAAERADFLCRCTSDALGEFDTASMPGLSLSIGVATRGAGSGEPLDNLMNRADQAMYQVKRAGRGNWRMSQAADA